jgi:hypothetical protein
VLGDRRIPVVEVVDQWIAPDHRYFKIRGEAGDTYIVGQEVSSGAWSVTVFRRGSR